VGRVGSAPGAPRPWCVHPSSSDLLLRPIAPDLGLTTALSLQRPDVI